MKENLFIRKVRTNTEKYSYGRRHELTGWGIVAVLGIAAVGSAFAVNDDYGDVFGDPDTYIPIEAVRRDAVSRYEEVVGDADPAAKFNLQYAGVSTVTVPGNYADGSSLAGSLEDRHYAVSFTNDCMSNTAYDINGGEFAFNASGFTFSASVKVDVPTAAATAYVSSDNPDVLVIQSGNDNGVNLTFSGVSEGLLQPANTETQNVLDTYGCVSLTESMSERIAH